MPGPDAYYNAKFLLPVHDCYTRLGLLVEWHDCYYQAMIDNTIPRLLLPSYDCYCIAMMATVMPWLQLQSHDCEYQAMIQGTNCWNELRCGPHSRFGGVGDCWLRLSSSPLEWVLVLTVFISLGPAVLGHVCYYQTMIATTMPWLLVPGHDSGAQVLKWRAGGPHSRFGGVGLCWLRLSSSLLE